MQGETMLSTYSAGISLCEQSIRANERVLLLASVVSVLAIVALTSKNILLIAIAAALSMTRVSINIDSDLYLANIIWMHA